MNLRRPGRAGQQWLPLVAVAVLLGAAMVAAAYGNPVLSQWERGTPTGQMPRPDALATVNVEPPVSMFPDSSDFQLPVWVGWVAVISCLGLVLAVVAWLLWTFLSERLPTEKPQPLPAGAEPTLSQTRQQMREAVAIGLADLDDDDGDPRRAVIACWVRLEAAAARAGTKREPGDTSTELVTRLLQAHDVDAQVLGRFADLYRRARFAPHTVDPAMREQARDALRRLRDDLSTPARLVPAERAPA